MNKRPRARDTNALPPGAPKRPQLFEFLRALEPRVLLDAAGATTAVDAAVDAVASEQAAAWSVTAPAVSPPAHDARLVEALVANAGPVAIDDARSFDGFSLFLDPLSNDTAGTAAINPDSLRFVDPPPGATLEANGRSLVVPGEGIWRVESRFFGGTEIVFRPGNSAPTGALTPVHYVVDDVNGNTSNRATVRTTDAAEPRLQPDTDGVFAGGRTLVADPLANDFDASGLDADSFRFEFSFLGETDVSADGREAVVADVGTWRRLDDGRVEFEPEAGFFGAPSIRYSVADVLGNRGFSGAFIELNDGVAADLDDVTADFAPREFGDIDIDVLGDQQLTESFGDGFLVVDGERVDSLSVEGEGRWSTFGGALVFRRESGFTGTPTPQQYVFVDLGGNATNTITVSLRDAFGPDLVRSRLDAAPASPRSFDIFAGSAATPAERATATLRSTHSDAVVSNDGARLRVPGEGDWSLVNGTLTFAPDSALVGDPLPAVVVLRDALGNQSETTFHVDFPIMPVDDVVRVAPGSGFDVDILVNDVGLDQLSEDSFFGHDVSIATRGGFLTTFVDVEGEGQWSVGFGERADSIRFDPEPGFDGIPSPIEYAIEGHRALVLPVAAAFTGVVARSDSPFVVAENGRYYVDVLANDEGAIDPSTLELVQPSSSSFLSGPGSWSVDGGSARLIYTPGGPFDFGQPIVRYSVADANGVRSNVGVVTPTLAGLARDDVRDFFGDRQTVFVGDNDIAGDGDGVRGLVGNDGELVQALTVPGEGEWTVDGGLVEFQPVPGFTGDPSAVRYAVADRFGFRRDAMVDLVDRAEPVIEDRVVRYPGTTVTVDLAALESSEALDFSTLDIAHPSFFDVDGDGAHFEAGTGRFDIGTEGVVSFEPLPGLSTAPERLFVNLADAAGNIGWFVLSFEDVAAPPIADVEQAFTGTSVLVDTDIAVRARIDREISELDRSGEVVAPSLETRDAWLLDDGDRVNTLVVAGEGRWFTADGLAAASAPDAGGDGAGGELSPSPGGGFIIVFSSTSNGTFPNPDADDSIADEPFRTVLEAGRTTTVALAQTGSADIPAPSREQLVFMPEAGFTGTPSPVQFVFQDPRGNVSEPATVALVDAAAPTLDVATQAFTGAPLHVEIGAAASEALDVETVTLASDSARAVAAADRRSIDVAGEGRWTVEADGSLRFEPAPDFLGSPSPVDVEVADAAGNRSAPARVMAIDAAAPRGAPDVLEVGPSGGLSAAPLDNDAGDALPASFSFGGSTFTQVLNIEGEGEWRFDTTTERVTFTPAGTAGGIFRTSYTVADAAGNRSAPIPLLADVPARVILDSLGVQRAAREASASPAFASVRDITAEPLESAFPAGASIAAGESLVDVLRRLAHAASPSSEAAVPDPAVQSHDSAWASVERVAGVSPRDASTPNRSAAAGRETFGSQLARAARAGAADDALMRAVAT